MDKHELEYFELKDRIENELINNSISNFKLLNLHSTIELMKLDIEEHDELTSQAKVDILNKLDDLNSKLSLKPTKPKDNYYYFDYTFRAICFSCAIITFGAFFSLPVLFIRWVESFLLSYSIISPYNKLSDYLRKFICSTIVRISGISVVTENFQKSDFEQPCSMAMFNHTCSLDVFLFPSLSPVLVYGFMRKEFYFIPFFSWLALALGCVPIDRENREKAVKTLKRIANVSKESHCCFGVTIEGTRSKTGLLLPFKKGIYFIFLLRFMFFFT